MSYTKTTWANGDVITAQKMNNIQNGIEGIGNTSGKRIIDFSALPIYGDYNGKQYELCFQMFKM